VDGRTISYIKIKVKIFGVGSVSTNPCRESRVPGDAGEANPEVQSLR
jgi:hypothetical protein